MINIDTVYQKVLAIANKEQRGYVTPQEFNLFADQAQKDIFEQYFYDLNQFLRVPGNNTNYADTVSVIEHKLQHFEKTLDSTSIGQLLTLPDGAILLPDDIYRIIRVELNNRDCSILNLEDFRAAINNVPLLKPSTSQPIANIRNNEIRVNVGETLNTNPTFIYYYSIPKKPIWNYIVTNGEALYSGTGVDFELDISEENNLINKILQLAGIMMNNELYQAASQEEIKDIQQEKS